MKWLNSKIGLSGLTAIVSILVAFVLSNTSLVKRWNNQAGDLLFRASSLQIHPDESVIIAIDQNSLDYFQKNARVLWPWPRDIYAAMTEYLTWCGAKVVCFDVIFSSPDIDRVNSKARSNDAQFARQMEQNNQVVLASQLEDSTRLDLAGSLMIGRRRMLADVPELFIHSYPSITLPIEKFSQAMALPGAVNFIPDEDGTCRREPLLFEYKGQPVPYMAMSAVMLWEDTAHIDFDERTHRFIVGDFQIPVDEKGRFELYWYGPGGPENTFKYVSAAQVLNSYVKWKRGLKPPIAPEVFKDKAVFIGATAAGLLDLKTTPFSSIEPYPGVEIYATLFSNIINNDFIQHLSFWQTAVGFFMILFLLAFAWQKINIYLNIVLTLTVFFMPAGLAVFLFKSHQMFIPVIEMEFAVVISVISILAVNYLTEGRQKKQIKQVFSRYLHPEVVHHLTQEPDKLQMGGKEIMATSLFTDLQGFTSISEYFTPPEIVHFLNQYFEKVEQVVFKCNGMLDKYTGDGIMAIFGAPVENNRHAHNACDAILAFQGFQKMEVDAVHHKIPLVTRVGAHSGSMVVGNIGSSNKMDYTAIGDTVNTSARLEGINKIYGTLNTISETTYDLVKDDFICRETDFIRVKGRKRPLRIYNVICRKENLNENQQLLLSIHHEALALYRNRDYRTAGKIFQQLIQEYPGDSVALAYIERCKQLRRFKNLVDEDGIFNVNVK